jgi:MarR family transcriptional regulator, negative regulator of the multidrug operon emrRAB
MRGIERLAAVNRSTPAMSAALPNLPMPETVMVRLIRIGVVGLGQFFEPVFRGIGLTETSFHVLCLLVATDRGEASPSELSELVGTSRANMTRILDALANDRLVSRNVEERDARRQIVRITAEGRRNVSDSAPRLAEPLQRAFSGLNAEEFSQLDDLLRKVIRSFDRGALPLRESA